mgnify:CR=1 FL=1
MRAMKPSTHRPRKRRSTRIAPAAGCLCVHRIAVAARVAKIPMMDLNASYIGLTRARGSHDKRPGTKINGPSGGYLARQCVGLEG